MNRLMKRLVNLVKWVLVAAAAALLLALVLVPKVAGWVPLTILTGSMEPTIPTGSQVIVEPLEGEEDAARLQIGDVITFMPFPDDGTLVTHRIVERSVGSDGNVQFTTQGDANGSADPWELTATQLRGHLKYHVPYAGYLATALDPSQKQLGIKLVAAGLVGYAIFEVGRAVRDSRRRSEEVAP